MVRDVFRLAREHAPSIIFIDEIDAIATKRFDAQTGADREVQRILLELLNQMDGFDQGSNVKVSVRSSVPNKRRSTSGIGYHGHQSSGYPGSGLATPRASRSKDRIPVPVKKRKAAHLPNRHEQNEPRS